MLLLPVVVTLVASVAALGQTVAPTYPSALSAELTYGEEQSNLYFSVEHNAFRIDVLGFGPGELAVTHLHDYAQKVLYFYQTQPGGSTACSCVQMDGDLPILGVPAAAVFLHNITHDGDSFEVWGVEEQTSAPWNLLPQSIEVRYYANTTNAAVVLPFGVIAHNVAMGVDISCLVGNPSAATLDAALFAVPASCPAPSTCSPAPPLHRRATANPTEIIQGYCFFPSTFEWSRLEQ